MDPKEEIAGSATLERVISNIGFLTSLYTSDRALPAEA